MPAEVADIRVVVGGEVPDAVVELGAGVDDTLGIVRESRQGAAVFLRLELLGVGAGFGIVDLERVVGAREEEEFARRVKVEGNVVVLV